MTETFEKRLDDLVSNIRRYYSPEKIILFGSCSDGKYDEDSDVDLLVIKKTNKHPVWRRVEARKASRAKIPMDILVYTPSEIQQLLRDKSFFIVEIMEKGKILYERQ